ncbi:MAG: hypothetical protein PHQ80_00565 [Candidatus ainarchaeum sp.]|nr:hypothetical protein [Candidatus ainarchaeum sp.]
MGKTKSNFFLQGRNALAICIAIYAILLIRAFSVSYFPGGVDTATHLFQIGLIAEEGLTPWNHWWYAGHPLLEQYPPLSHLAGAAISGIVGVENAYKLIFSIAFILIPISFFLLLKEFDFTEEQRALALYLFSLSPVFAYDLNGGLLSAMLALPFCFLFLKYMIRAFNAKEWIKPAALSAVFLAIAALAHLFMPFAAAMFGFIYLVSYSPSAPSLKRFASIMIFTAALAGFFWFPLALNYSIGDTPINFSESSLAQVATIALAPFGRAFAVYINLVSVLSALILSLLSIFSLLSTYRAKDSPSLRFFLLSISAIILWSTFLPHSDQAGVKLPLFIPMVFAILIPKYISPVNILFPLSALFLALLLVSSFLAEPSYVSPETFGMAEWAASQTQHRALLIPPGMGLLAQYEGRPNMGAFLYDAYMLPHYFHKEIYNGWFAEASPRSLADVSFTCSGKKSFSEIMGGFGILSTINLGKMKECEVPASPEEFCNALQSGSVDTIIANSNFPEVVSFADSAPCLSRSSVHSPLVAYKVVGSKPYLSQNWSYEKKSGTISIHFNGPFSGTLSISESHYPYWKAYLDSNQVPVEKSSDGFLSIPIQVSGGPHELELSYSPNNYFGAFSLISAIAWLAALLLLNASPRKKCLQPARD